ncbi:OprD family outer membrane porin [Paraburkholderia sediminicola]|uniref:OprD family outer membrane porin n=1 Tax=Paraburkholderia sediminicola TaxID=458836 RepID=UPI000E770B19
MLTTTCNTSALGAPGETLEEDELTRGTTRPWRVEEIPSLFAQSETTVSITFYSRNRHATDHVGDIHVNALGVGLDWRSGYVAGPWGFVGADLSGFANLRLMPATGLSEVLYHDYRDGTDKSYATLAQAALKWRSSAAGDGWQVRGGYTPISVGTLGTSGGLHTHAYRGGELKYRAAGWEIGYGWADQFRNEWDDRFRTMTNAWHQNRDQYDGAASRIDFVHSVGIRYEADTTTSVDLGVGEGRRYRRNAQVIATRAWQFADGRSMTASGYALWGRYDAALGPTAAPRNEWHASTNVAYVGGPLSVSLGFGMTHAPDSGEMNFRLTPWANSDNRNQIQTWGQLDDFVWDGTRVLKAAASLQVGSYVGMPGLALGVSGIHGWAIRNPGRSNTSANEIDLSLTYDVKEGPLKGLGLGIFPARLRTNGFYGKSDRNDMKFIVSYRQTF